MSRSPITLRQLQVFAAVAQLGSTTAAATAVSLSQSATSAALGQLEHLLGAPLFDRVGKRLHLNDQGRALRPRAQALLDGAARLAQRPGQHDLGALRIGASTTIGNHIVPSLLAHMLTSSDDAAGLHLKINNTERICAAVAGFELDVGLIEGTPTHAGLHLTPWLHDELVLVAAPELVRHRARVSLHFLQQARWLLRELGSGTREVADQHLLPFLGHYPRSLELGSSEAIVGAASAGLGVACLSLWVVRDAIARCQLKRLDTPLPPIWRQHAIVTQHQKHPTPALAHFLDMVRSWQGDRTTDSWSSFDRNTFFKTPLVKLSYKSVEVTYRLNFPTPSTLTKSVPIRHQMR